MHSIAAPAHSAVLASAIDKVKWRILPVLVVMFIANYIDRVNLGFVRAHLQADLGIGAAAFGLGAGLFFIGYAIFEVPSNLLLQKYGAKVWLTRIMGSWGLAAAAMAFVQGERSFYALRLLLGMAEAGFFPGVVFYFTQWLPASERGKAMAVFLSGSALASVICGPLTGALLQLDGAGLRGWQWMFLLEGLFSVLLCALAWRRLDAHVHDAAWLTDAERAALTAVMAAEVARRQSRATPNVGLWGLLKERSIWLFCLIYFAIQLTIYGVTFWLPSIINQIGQFSTVKVGWFNAIPWLISIVAMYLFASLAARFRFQQAWVAATLAIAAAGMFLSTIGGPVVSFVAICFAGIGFKSAAALFWPMPQAYLNPRIAAAGIALINSLGNLGGFVAPATLGYLEQSCGSIQRGLYLLSATSLVAAALVFFTRKPRQALPAG